MNRMLRNDKGLTLVELVVAAILILLVGISIVPWLQSGSMKAERLEEAESTLKNINFELWQYYRAQGSFPVFPDTVLVAKLADAGMSDIVSKTAMNREHFDDSDYFYVSKDEGVGFLIILRGGTKPNKAPMANKAKGFFRTINDDGEIKDE